jgi:uncharacterized protein (DUF1330 family)
MREIKPRRLAAGYLGRTTRLCKSPVDEVASAEIQRRKSMSVIVLVQGTPRPDRKDALAQYQQAARAVIAKHGGEVVARGSGLGGLHGSGNYQVGIVLRFADKAAAEGWYNDPDYRKVLPLRDEAYAALEINMFQE